MSDAEEDVEERPARGGMAAVLEQHRAELLRFLRARCIAPIEPEDILHELWIGLALRPVGPVGNPRAYLFRMANNLVIDRVRAGHAGQARDARWLDSMGRGQAEPGDLPDPAPGAEAELIVRQEEQALASAIAALPERARTALMLHRLDGLGQADVASRMGISRSGVEKHLALALRRLREIFRQPDREDCGDGPSAPSKPIGKGLDAGGGKEHRP